MVDFSEIGVTAFYHDLDTPGGKLRGSPDDFQVEERFADLKPMENGEVLVLKVRARNWENNRLVRFIARSNHVSPKRVYFSGTKDRRAVKVQYFSIPGVKFREFNLEDVEILEHFYLDHPLGMGTHLENRFRIRVRECDSLIFAGNCEKVRIAGIVPNYYGPQRFGPMRPVTHLVGREIVRGNFREAVRIFVGFPGMDRFAEIRKEFYDNPDPSLFIDRFPKSLDLERDVMEYLLREKEDYVGAIKVLPDNLVTMFIHAYQGYLFNKILSRRLSVSKGVIIGDIFNTGSEAVKVNSMNVDTFSGMFNSGKGSPTGLVVGYDVEKARGEMGRIEEEVIREEGLNTLDFKLPFGMKSRGERRDLFLRPREMQCGDCYVEFALQPGSYATSVMREIIRVNEMANY
jgi:tRNA pseudouridine13 synthase